MMIELRVSRGRLARRLLLLLSRINVNLQVDKQNAPPETKKQRLSLTLKKRQDRFGSISECELEEMAQFKMRKNSEQSSKWAMKNLGDWMEVHNKRNMHHYWFSN